MSRDALVVGINTYKFLPSLKAPARDAEAIAQQFHLYGEFRVHRLPEVIQEGKPQIGQKTAITLRELETALINLFKPKGNTIPQTAIFYFSGHGIQRDAGIQEGYLALSDSNPDKGIFGLSLFWLRRLLQESPVRQRIVILDCCNSGELLNFLEADPGARPGTDRLFMAAAREYETAYESIESPYSVFTQAILTGLDPRRNESGIVTNHSLTDWVSHSLKGEIQQPLFESSGSEIILTRCGAGQPIAPQPVQASATCPYRGLEYFNEDHADYFFGREELTATLLDKVQRDRFVAVVGASGIGKSSLVRAGLLSHLKQQSQWQIKLLTPTDRPLRSLASSFIEPDASQLDRADQLRRAESFLQDGGKGLVQLVQASLPAASILTERPRMLLVIDQFEEVFTLSRGLHAEQERQQFFNCLLQALELANGTLSLVIVLRADFQAKSATYGGFAEQIDRHRIVVDPLKYEQIKATILKPAQKAGLVCEPSLVYHMLSDVVGAPGELSLLQYTLLELWQQRRTNTEGKVACLTLDAYQELGGVRGTLQKRATKVFNHLTEIEQAVAKRVFLALTQLGEGTEDTRRRVTKSELVSPAFPVELIEQVLEKLVAAKLVVTSQAMSQATSQATSQVTSQIQMEGGENSRSIPNASTSEILDVVHETLIRHWSLLRGWLDENREMLRRLRRIEQAAQEWDSAGQPSAGEYLMHGLRMRDAEDFNRTYPGELSAVAQQCVAASHEEIRRARRESRQLQIAVPTVLLIALAAIFNQYRGAIDAQAEQSRQLQLLMARERAAIAQNILQDKNHDPMAALLISRVAAESSESTPETQNSLRSALQALRLQLEIPGHQGAVHQLAFSADRQHLATAGADGTIQLWGVNAQTIYNTVLQPPQTLQWSEGKPAEMTALTFSPDGRQIAAIAKDSPLVKVWSVATGTVMLQLTSLAAVTQIVFSPDGKWIATAQSDRTFSVWQADTGQLQARLPLTAPLTQIQFSPDGQRLLVASGNVVQLWHLAIDPTQLLKLQPIAPLNHPQPLVDAHFSPSGRWIATACQDGKVRLWLPTGQVQQTIAPVSPVAQTLASLQFSPDETTIAAIDRTHHGWLWKTQTGQLQAEFNRLPDAMAAEAPNQANEASWLRFSPNGRFMLTSSDRRNVVRLLNAKTGKEIGDLSGRGDAVTAAQFSPDSTYVATASPSGLVQLWATEAEGELPTIQANSGAIGWTAFLPNQSAPTNQRTTASVVNTLATLTPNGTLQTWQIVSDMPQDASPIHQSPTSLPIQTAAIGSHKLWQQLLQFLGQRSTSANPTEKPSDQRVAAAEATLQVKLEPETPNTPAATAEIVAPALSMASRSLNSALSLLPVSASETAAQLSGAALSRDGHLIATADADGILTIRRLQADRSLTVIHQMQNWRTIIGRKDVLLSQVLSPNQPVSRGERVTLTRLSFSPDGSTVMAIGNDSTVRLWDTYSGQLLQVLQGHEASIQQARFSPDGQFIITASWDKTARIWQVKSGQTVKILFHGDAVTSASFSPNGRQVVTTSWDKTAQIWDAASGDKRQQLVGHQSAVLDAQFSPDGRSIATASKDGTAILWDSATGTQQAQLRPADATETPDPIAQVNFSPDSQFVATRTQTGKVYLWAATWEKLLEMARDRSLRQLTPDECSRYLKVTPTACPNLALRGEA